ncbi:MAG: hypothetical protein V7L20_14115 [Nostoc sp.]|uniref:hypothetical protein n=1 Tax=Nostoc sp. TaxID=1180 RepID=UPI002FFCDAC5
MKKRSRLKNEIGKILGEQLDTEKAQGRPVKLVRNRIADCMSAVTISGTGKGFDQ